MAYDLVLAQRIREMLTEIPDVEEKMMFGGICFMVNGKMCMGVLKDNMMCRIDPLDYESALEKNGCREMDFSGKQMKGFVYVDETGLRTGRELKEWVALCLAFNPKAKASKKKK